jgi:hypothetical protein
VVSLRQLFDSEADEGTAVRKANRYANCFPPDARISDRTGLVTG